MITSRLDHDASTTIPEPVRKALRLSEGDAIRYLIEGDRVVILRASVIGAEDPFGIFEEWDSEADRKAYAGL